jgi:hypothetical protein
MPKPKSAKTGQSGFTPARTNSNVRLRSVAARTVGEFVPALMRPAFEKFGFPAAAILTDWAAIAGPELAAFTAPERLKWPRRASGDDAEADQAGATLLLRVGGARALEVEHSRERLIERINAAFGYRAVTTIRLIQAPIPRAETKAPPAAPAAQAEHGPLIAALPEDERLKTALTRISAGLKARRPAPEPASL